MSHADPTDHLAADSDAETLVAGLEPPQGWTDDPEELMSFWQGQPGDLKHVLQTAFKIPDPQLLLVRDQIGYILFLLQSKADEGSETKYYVWHGAEEELCWIKSPAGLQEIYSTIDEKEGFLVGLELEVVERDESGGRVEA